MGTKTKLINLAKEVLKSEGYYMTSLWNVEDVQKMVKCTEIEAIGLLDVVLNGEGVNEYIWDTMKELAEMKGLELN